MIALLVVLPSLLLPFAPPPRASVRLDEAAVAEPAPTADEDAAAAVAEAAVPTIEDEIRALITSNAIELSSTEAFSKLKEIEKDHGVKGADAAEIKDQLVGSWKLAAASDAFYGVTGNAAQTYTKPLGHVQYFRKPDPMDIFSGNKDKLFFMETVEVIGNALKGTTSTAAIKGGFSISPDLGVVESYTKKEVDGRVVGEELMDLQAWQCVYMSETMRVCRTKGGDYRVYDKVDADAAAAEVARLAGTAVEIDEEAVAAEAAKAAAAKKATEEEEYDDPNIPAWQKRIDKLDGTKRTANGTPIVNHGPDRFGGGGGGPQKA